MHNEEWGPGEVGAPMPGNVVDIPLANRTEEGVTGACPPAASQVCAGGASLTRGTKAALGSSARTTRTPGDVSRSVATRQAKPSTVHGEIRDEIDSCWLMSDGLRRSWIQALLLL